MLIFIVFRWEKIIIYLIYLYWKAKMFMCLYLADVKGFLKSIRYFQKNTLKKTFYNLFKKELKAGPKVPKPAGRPRTRCWSSSIWKSTNFPKISFSFTTVVNIKTVLVRLNSPILQYFHLILQYVKEWKLSMAKRVINYKKTYF